MKRLLPLVAIASTLSFYGCSRDEKTALQEFQKDATAVWTWSNEEGKKYPHDPLAFVRIMKEMAPKMKAVKTDGLPADLKDPWNAYLDDMEKVVAVSGDLPAAADMSRIAADPVLGPKLQETMKKMNALKPKFGVDAEKLGEAAKKYGVEILK